MNVKINKMNKEEREFSKEVINESIKDALVKRTVRT